MSILEQSSSMDNTPTSSSSSGALSSLRRILLRTYTGPRLRATLDWSWYAMQEECSAYVQTLTELERQLFRAGASGTGAHYDWKQFQSSSSARRRRRRVVHHRQQQQPDDEQLLHSTSDNDNDDEAIEKRNGLLTVFGQGPQQKRQRVN